MDNCVGLHPSFSANEDKSRSRSFCFLISIAFSFVHPNSCRFKIYFYPDRNGLIYKAAYVFVYFILGPRVTVRLCLKRSLGEQESFTVLCVTQGHRQRSPCHETDTDFIIHFRQVKFTFLAAEHMIFGLFNDRSNTIELATICVRFHNLHK